MTRRSFLFEVILVLVLVHPGSILAQDSAVPEWARMEMQRQVGTWIADNSAYTSEQETDDAYGISYEWGTGEHTVVGELFGLRDGQRTGTYWEFRIYWDYETESLILSQFGVSGVLGIGAFQDVTETTSKVQQTFHSPSGASWETGHTTTYEPDRQTGTSYAIGDDGTWTPERTYIWIRQPD